MFHTDIIVPIITASGAIGGAILGTYFTGKHALNIEDKRIKEQQKKQDEISLRVMRLISVELVKLISIFEEIVENEDNPEDLVINMKLLIGVDNQYPKLPIEMKISALKPDVLAYIEEAYMLVGHSIYDFNSMYPKYERGEITHKKLIEELDPKGDLKFLRRALERIKGEFGIS